MTMNWLLLYVTHINLIVPCGLQLETDTTQTTILNVPWSAYEIKFVFHSDNPLQLL